MMEDTLNPKSRGGNNLNLSMDELREIEAEVMELA
jgi:hypothetical protein